MSIAAEISADMRARANFLPWCPTCSAVGVDGFPDQLIGPSFREFRGLVRLTACCSLSACDEVFETQAEAAKWWREKRQQEVPCVATDSRRRSMLAKLRAAELEAIV